MSSVSKKTSSTESRMTTAKSSSPPKGTPQSVLPRDYDLSVTSVVDEDLGLNLLHIGTRETPSTSQDYTSVTAKPNAPEHTGNLVFE